METGLPLKPQHVLQRLESLCIPFEHYEHEPVASSADRFPLDLVFGAQVCKNLLVCTRNESRFLLLMFPFEKNADLKALRAAFGTSRLCFAPDRALFSLLGQAPGNVGVCGVINDSARLVEVVFDTSLKNTPRVATHPGSNSQTIVLEFAGLEKYARTWGSTVHFFDF